MLDVVVVVVVVVGDVSLEGEEEEEGATVPARTARLCSRCRCFAALIFCTRFAVFVFAKSFRISRDAPRVVTLPLFFLLSQLFFLGE